ncbi:NAD(P)-binding protein [Tothia fuscella]|uniref:NAD(P)-binding protein n=1 Tax=Tothia fuscella TaxID=1048955 RepID=A0A9P4NW67_9PEZI|nr:NAD(P)-binding protein [Tothia fuscella]
MAPIRIALIGLSSAAKTSWAAEGHLPYLQSARGKSSYEIVALLNSTFRAPSSVKTYGDPAELAADPDIDLVVCNTRVDTHYSTTAPSFKAGKAVYIEWPLAENLQRSTELLGNQPSEKGIISLQIRVSTVVLKLKELRASDRIGRVLSSDVSAFSSILPRDALPEGLSYFTDRTIGGNPIMIGYAHMIDYVHEVLGELTPKVKILGKDDSILTSGVPDLLAIHGQLAKGKSNVGDKATLTVTWRSGQPFKGSPGLVWTINGEKGEIRITSPSGPYLQLTLDEPIKIELHDFESDEVQEIEWDCKDWQKELPTPARLSGKGEVEKEKEWPQLGDALTRMQELDMRFAQYDAQKL